MSEDFTHQISLDQIRDGDRVEIIADQAERCAIAARLDVPRIDRLEAQASLSRSGDCIRARGRVQASLEQQCVVTSDSVSAMIDEPFDLAFVPEPSVTNPDEEIELGEGDCDTMFHDGSRIDLGAAIVDTLALAIDPYPRSAGAESALKEAGVLSEAEASPFAALAKLKRSE